VPPDPRTSSRRQRRPAFAAFLSDWSNPDNLLAAKKRQNKITEYRAMLQKWHEHGAITCAGYIIGFPGDRKESILRDIEIIKRELPLDVLELFMLTPLPGSEDHKILWQQGDWMDPSSTNTTSITA
jgi:radical SAM superfamily enzyme